MRLTMVCLVIAIACGGSSRPRDVRASARDGFVEVSWEEGPLAGPNRVQLIDLDTGKPASEAVIVAGPPPPGPRGGARRAAGGGARALRNWRPESASRSCW